MFGKSKKWGRRKAGETLAQWPKDANGDPEHPAFLCHSAGDHMADVIVTNMLQSFGIPTVQLNSDNGDLGEIYSGISFTGADIFVPESMLPDAKALLEGESDHVNI